AAAGNKRPAIWTERQVIDLAAMAGQGGSPLHSFEVPEDDFGRAQLIVIVGQLSPGKAFRKFSVHAESTQSRADVDVLIAGFTLGLFLRLVRNDGFHFDEALVVLWVPTPKLAHETGNEQELGIC